MTEAELHAAHVLCTISIAIYQTYVSARNKNRSSIESVLVDSISRDDPDTPMHIYNTLQKAK